MTAHLDKKPLRILSITKSTGGLAQYNYRLCEALNRDRFAMDVVCLSDDNVAYAESLRQLGIRAVPMEMARYSISVWSDLRLVWQLWRFVRNEQYDVLLGHGSKSGFIVRLVARLTRVPAIYALHSMSFLPRIHGRKAYAYRLLEHAAGVFGGHIVTLCHSIKDDILRLKLARDSQVSVVHTGIDVSAFSQPAGRDEACRALGLDSARPVVGWAARFVPQKAPLDFVRAMATVCRDVPAAQIYMAGDGPLKDEAVALAERLGIAGQITFADWQTDVPLMLSAFDVYVLNSRWEGLPLSLLEAMAMSRACVATAVDGSKEVIDDGISGYLIAAGDAEGLAGRTRELLNDPSRREQMGRAAHDRVASYFNIERMMQDWEAVFYRVAASR